MTTAVIARDLVYLPVGRGRQAAVIAVDPRTGRTTARLRLPVLVPDPTALLKLPGSPAGALAADRGRGRVAALLAADGRVLAISATPLAAAVTDLASRASVSLGGYTRIVAATVGGDGIVYILAGSADPAFTLRFRGSTPAPCASSRCGTRESPTRTSPSRRCPPGSARSSMRLASRAARRLLGDQRLARRRRGRPPELGRVVEHRTRPGTRARRQRAVLRLPRGRRGLATENR